MEGREPHGPIHNFNEAVGNSVVGRYFKLKERGSSFTTEMRAGLATFLTLAYILAVNAAILTDSGGTCRQSDCTPDACSDPTITDLTQCVGTFFDGTATVPRQAIVAAGPGCIFPPENAGYAACLRETKKDLIIATAASSLIGCFIMGAFANLPLALAPGMGTNAYFTYTAVGFHGTGHITYQQALAAVFLEGWFFLIIAASGFRTKIAKLIPAPVRISTAAGIGMFLAFIGLQQGEGIGLVVNDGATLVTLGGCPPWKRTNFAPVSQVNGTLTLADGANASGNYACKSGRLQSATTWLGITGFLIISFCLIKNVRGAMIYGIAYVTIISWFRGSSQVTYFPHTEEGQARFDYFKKVVDFHTIQNTAGAFDFSAINKGTFWVSLITFLYVDMMDTTGTLYSMAKFIGFVDEEGNFPGQYPAFMSDATAIVVGSCLGTSPVTTFVESATGIREGGRTGLTALCVAFLFFISLFFAPIFASIPPWANGPPLILVGAMMMKAISEVNWNNPRDGIPAFLTIIIMPLTYSIAYGVIAGICCYILLNLPDWLWEKGHKLAGRPLPEPEREFSPTGSPPAKPYQDGGVPTDIKV
jgi:AGZA family xanthine/uracil permease-like MFS transporter